MDGGWKAYDSTGRQKVASRPTNVDAIPACEVSGAATGTITATHTRLACATETRDTDGMHDTVTNTSRITIRTPGVYVVNAAVSFDSSATGFRFVVFYINGSSIGIPTEVPAVNGDTTNVQVVMQRAFNVGDYIEVDVYQTSGGNLNATPTHFAATWLGPTRNVAITQACFSAYRAAARTLAGGGVFTSLLCDTTEFDSRGWFDTSTGRYTPKQAGWYRFSGAVNISDTLADTNLIIAACYKNGAEVKRGHDNFMSVASAGNAVFDYILEANGTTDFFEMYGFHSNASGKAITTGAQWTYFQGDLVQPKG